MDPISTALLTWGPPGAIILVLGMVCRHLYQALKESQESRIQDAQKVIGIHRDLLEKFHETSRSLQQGIDRLQEKGPLR